mgnify:CR=1 FL=1
MSDARAAILARLRAAPAAPLPELPDWAPPAFADRLERFRLMLEAVHGEVHPVPASEWRRHLRAILSAKGVGRVMAAPALAVDWPELVAYDRPIEDLKDLLVDGIDAAITRARAGIAETGSLVLWPDAEEPRLLSLLPPLHVVLLEAGHLVDSLAALMAAEDWAAGMPTNALLISGPSKTADIEQTLAYGVHGPKELVVLVLMP